MIDEGKTFSLFENVWGHTANNKLAQVDRFCKCNIRVAAAGLVTDNSTNSKSAAQHSRGASRSMLLLQIWPRQLL